VCLGVNDILFPAFPFTPPTERVTAARIIAGYRRLITGARHQGIRVVDFDEVLRDPDRPTQLLPAFASEDHLHVNDAGNVAQGNAIPLALFRTDRNPHPPSEGR
jgi:hypothetical protein